MQYTTFRQWGDKESLEHSLYRPRSGTQTRKMEMKICPRVDLFVWNLCLRNAALRDRWEW